MFAFQGEKTNGYYLADQAVRLQGVGDTHRLWVERSYRPDNGGDDHSRIDGAPWGRLSVRRCLTTTRADRYFRK